MRIKISRKTREEKAAKRQAKQARAEAFRERFEQTRQAAKEDAEQARQARRESEVQKRLLPSEQVVHVYREGGLLDRWVALTDRRIVLAREAILYDAVERLGDAPRPWEFGFRWAITTKSGGTVDVDFIPKGDRAQFEAEVLERATAAR